MQIDFLVILGYISAIILFLGTPGPVTVMVTNASAKSGFKAGFATVAGTNTASLILIAVSFIVIQGAFAVSETALMWLTLFGSLYLLYFSITIIKDKIDLQAIESVNNEQNLSVGSNENGSVVKKHFRDGFIIGISNPKDILFFIGFFPTFFKVSSNTTVSMVILTLVWVLLDYVILTGYSLVFSKITNFKLVNLISKLSGVILLLVAVYAIYHTSHGLFFK